MIQIRVGIPESTGEIPRAARRLGAAVLLSAGALWDTAAGRFFAPSVASLGFLDIALDSSGFVRGLSGYPWTVREYVRGPVAAFMGFWRWWSQMDLPCEEAIAPDREAVRQRIERSAAMHAECIEEARRWLEETTPGSVLREAFSLPVPVLQGREPDDYRRSADLLAQACGGELPDFVGVGSMCTRPISGEAGLMKIAETLDSYLPARVRLHLFGVKGAALGQLRDMPRIASIDSMAWDKRASWAQFEQRGRQRDRYRANGWRTAERIGQMEQWLATQRAFLGADGTAEIAAQSGHV